MDLERSAFPGRPIWVRAVLFSALVAAAWVMLGMLSAFDLLPFLLGAPAVLVLVLSPLGLARVFPRGGPAFGAMIAVGIALTVTAFTVPNDLYLNVRGSSQQAAVVEETCVRSKRRCSWSYQLEGADGKPVNGHLEDGRQSVGDEVEVVTDPAGVLPPRRARDVAFGFFDLLALVAWSAWIVLVVQGIRADRREGSP